MIEDAYKRLNGLSQHVLIGASRRGELAREGFEDQGVFTAALLRTLQRKPEYDGDRTLGVKESACSSRRKWSASPSRCPAITCRGFQDSWEARISRWWRVDSNGARLLFHVAIVRVGQR